MNVKAVVFLCFGLLACAISCTKDTSASDREPYRIDSVLVANNAMVVTAHPLASDIGIEIMKKGGNAIDAAVATQFALAVTYPRAGNIGGGGFMVIREPNGTAHALDYREKAPAAAHRDMYLDSLLNVIPNLSVDGHLAVGVPGTVAGMYAAWKKLGRIEKFSTLVEPAIRIAREGFRVNSAEAERLTYYQPDFSKYHDEHSPFMRASWKVGDTIIQEDLAKSLQRIADAESADGFYKGETADLFVAEMARGNGIITKEDLANYNPVWREPQIGYYKDNRVISMPPPSSGGIALLQMLEMAEKFPLDKMSPDGTQYMHTMAEVFRRVYADRAEFLGDEDFVDVPKKQLLDSMYLIDRMTSFNPTSATKSKSIGSGEIQIKLESFETTHTSIVDADGMAVSITTTLNLNYGSKAFVNGAGFFLNNEMDDFSSKPGVPNSFGLLGNEKNAIAPAKRMLSSMTPTIVESDGKLKLILGTPGGSTIITSVCQVMLNVLEHGMTLDEAVFHPRFHHQWLPDKIMIEKEQYSPAVLDSLTDRGHEIGTYNAIGLVKAILMQDDGTIVGVGDRRSDDDAAGY